MKLRTAVCSLLAVVFLAVDGCSRSAPERLSPLAAAGPLVPAAELATTDVLPHTEGSITPGRNYVYCATFQLAWNELQDDFIKAPIELEGMPAMAKFLNRRSFRRSDLSAKSYLAMAGTVKDGIIERIRQAMRDKFPPSNMTVPDARTDTAIFVYAYLEKSLAFREAFDRLREPLKFRMGNRMARVAAFGIRAHTNDNDRASLLTHKE